MARFVKPEIFETDQRSHFTSREFTSLLIADDILISMDGKGARRNHVLVERLWKPVKYGQVYLRACASVSEARVSIGRYLDCYNSRRTHYPGLAMQARVWTKSELVCSTMTTASLEELKELAAVFVMIPLGLAMTYRGDTIWDGLTDALYSSHKLIGFLVLWLSASWLIYRLVHGAPPDEPTLEWWQKEASHLVHWALSMACC